jgi:hypothetical protein
VADAPEPPEFFDFPAPPIEEALRATTDPQVLLRTLAQFSARRLERLAPFHRMLRSAGTGDPELGAYIAADHTARRGRQRANIHAIAANGPLRLPPGKPPTPIPPWQARTHTCSLSTTSVGHRSDSGPGSSRPHSGFYFLTGARRQIDVARPRTTAGELGVRAVRAVPACLACGNVRGGAVQSCAYELLRPQLDPTALLTALAFGRSIG